MEHSILATIAAGIGGIGAGAYGMYRKILSDMRNDNMASLHDDAIQHLIKNLRDEIDRMADRLAAVEEQNRKCEERNEELAGQIRDLKLKLQVA